MTRRAADGTGRRVRTALAWLVALAVVVVAALLVGPPGDDRPLDPSSPGPSGLLGVVELLGQMGVDVGVSTEVPSDADTRVFLPLDLLSDERRDEWRAWVEGGGTLVVADAGSPLHGFEPTVAEGVGFGVVERSPACPLPALEPVRAVAQPRWPLLRVADGGADVACFGDADAGWLVVTARGAGAIVALGSADPFTNALLDRADNAVLAAALLGPAPGDRIQIVPRPAVGEGDRGLLDLIDPRVWDGIFLVLLALLTAVVWRARRLGRPVAEVLPPVLPGAELVRSVADLHQRAGARQRAADQLRRAARGRVRAALRSTRGSQADLAGATATRLGLDRDEATLALVDAPVGSEQELLEVARSTRAVIVACDDHLRDTAMATSGFADTSMSRQTDPTSPRSPTGGARDR